MNIFKFIFGISVVLILASGYTALNYHRLSNLFKTSQIKNVEVVEVVEKRTFYGGYITFISFNNKKYKMVKADNTKTEWAIGEEVSVFYYPKGDSVYYYKYPVESRLIGAIIAFIVFCSLSIYFFKYVKKYRIT